MIWPYSASKQTWSFLLVEPDFRLRRQRGQVRVSFYGPCARRIARYGLASGDEINLSVAGAQWAEDAAQDQTPGRTVGWELSYGERVVVEVRNSDYCLTECLIDLLQKISKTGQSLLVDTDAMSPSPEPERSLLSLTPPETPNGVAQTPVQKPVSHRRTNNNTWASPAFLHVKESPSLSLLGRTADPFWDDQDTLGGEHPAKRMKFGRSSGQWRFVERTPSPENEAPPEPSDAIVVEDTTAEISTGRPEGDIAPAEAGDPVDMRQVNSPAVLDQEDQVEVPEANEDLAPIKETPQPSIEAVGKAQEPDVEYPETRETERNSSVETEVIPHLPKPAPTDAPLLATSIPQSFHDGQSMTDAQPRSSPFATMMSSPKLASSPPLPPEAMVSFRDKSPALRIDIQGATPRMDNLPEDEIEAPDTPRLQPLPSPGLDIVSPIETRSQAPAAFFDQQRHAQTLSQGPRQQTSYALMPSNDHGSVESSSVPNGNEESSSLITQREMSGAASPQPVGMGSFDSEKPVVVENIPDATVYDGEMVLVGDLSVTVVEEADELDYKNSTALRPTTHEDTDHNHDQPIPPSLNEFNTNLKSMVDVREDDRNATLSEVQDTDVQVMEDIDPGVSDPQTLYYNIPGLSGNADTQEIIRETNATDSTNARPPLNKQDSLFEEMMAYIDADNDQPAIAPHVEAQEIAMEVDVDEISDRTMSRTDHAYIDPALQNLRGDILESSTADAQQAPLDLGHNKESPSDMTSIHQPAAEYQQAMEVDAPPFSSSLQEGHEHLEYEVPDTYVDEEELPYPNMNLETPKQRIVEVIDLGSSDEEESSSVLEEPAEASLADESVSDKGESSPASPDPKVAVQVVVDRVATSPRVDENPESDIEPSRQTLATSSDIEEEAEDPEMESEPQYTIPSSLPLPASQRSRPFTRAQSRLANFVLSDEEDSLTTTVMARDFAVQYPQTPEASQKGPKDSLAGFLANLNRHDEPSLPTPRPTQRSVADLDEDSQSQELHTIPKETNVHEESDDHQRASQLEKSQVESTMERVKDVEEMQSEYVDTDPLSQQASSLPHSTAATADMDPTSTTSKSHDLHASAEPLAGLRTSLSYYVPLPSLYQHVNDRIDVFAICVSATKPVKAKTGRRDFSQTLYLADPSSSTTSTLITTANLFRPFARALPSPTPGEVILLRECKVESRQRKMMLSSTSTSSWAVWRRNVGGQAAEMEVKGPPVEVGAEERGFVRGLNAWWDSLDGGFRDRITAAMPSSAKGKVKVVQPNEIQHKENSENQRKDESKGKRKKESEDEGQEEGKKRRKVESKEATIATKADTQPITAKEKEILEKREREKQTPEPTRSSARQKATAAPSTPVQVDEYETGQESPQPTRSSPRNKKTTAASSSSIPPNAGEKQKGKPEKRVREQKTPEPTRTSQRQRAAVASALSTPVKAEVEETEEESSQPVRRSVRKKAVTALSSSSSTPAKVDEEETEGENSQPTRRSRVRKKAAAASPSSLPSEADEEETEEESSQPTKSSRAAKTVKGPTHVLEKSKTKHTLRSGMKYSDEVSVPRPKSSGKGSGNDLVHELRDGRKWKDPGV